MLPYLPWIVSTVCCPIDCTGCLGHFEEGSQAQCISRTACLAAVVAGASLVPKRQIRKDMYVHVVAVWGA